MTAQEKKPNFICSVNDLRSLLLEIMKQESLSEDNMIADILQPIENYLLANYENCGPAIRHFGELIGRTGERFHNFTLKKFLEFLDKEEQLEERDDKIIGSELNDD